jgi:Tfp pilus assembly protein PilX
VDGNRGVALILALLVLSFLAILGGALLTASTIDIWISDNYKITTQSLYIAEAGIEDGREAIRASGRTLTELLTTAAGSDFQLATADDQPLIARRSVGTGFGAYEVWLRNDNSDGALTLTDRNEIVTLVSIGQYGSATKTIEATVRKGSFPIAAGDPRLQTVNGLEGLATSIAQNAQETYTGAVLTSSGSPTDYRVVVANGNLELGPGTGYGLLLVRGDLTISGAFTWNGLIAVIGQGAIHSSGPLTINGGLFVAKTRAVNGSLLMAPQGVNFTVTDVVEMKAASHSFPYNSIAIRER